MTWHTGWGHWELGCQLLRELHTTLYKAATKQSSILVPAPLQHSTATEGGEATWVFRKWVDFVAFYAVTSCIYTYRKFFVLHFQNLAWIWSLLFISTTVTPIKAYLIMNTILLIAPGYHSSSDMIHFLYKAKISMPIHPFWLRPSTHSIAMLNPPLTPAPLPVLN